jgi:hypothetical protein
MWVFLAGFAGIVLCGGVGQLAKRVFLSGRKTSGRLIASTRWPLWCASVSVSIGLARGQGAGTLLRGTPVVFAAGLAGFYSYLVVKATYRTYRILRSRRAAASP